MRVRSLCLAALVVLVMLGGCGGRGVTATRDRSPSGTSSVRPSATTPDWRWQADKLSMAATEISMSSLSWTFEPRGPADVLAGGWTLVFARVCGVRDGGRTVLIDCLHCYSGGAAVREARKDGAEIQGTAYWPNRHKYVEKLNFTPMTSIVVRPTLSREYEADQSMVAVTPDEFARRLKDPEFPDAREYLRRNGFWIVVDGHDVRAMVEEYVP